MKKLSVILAVTLILCAVFPLVVSADPDKKVVVSYGTPVLGGSTTDPIWDSVQGNKVNEDNAFSLTDTVSEWKIMWDENKMYFQSNVTDSSVNSQSETRWQNDCQYLIIDFEHSSDFDTYFYNGGGSAIGMRFCVPGVIDLPDTFGLEFMGDPEFLDPSDPLFTSIDKYIRITPTGYIIEYSLDPRKFYPAFKLEAGSKGGLDFVNDDSIDIADRAIYYSWSENGGTWGEPNNLSVFELAPKPVAPVVEPEPETAAATEPVTQPAAPTPTPAPISAPQTGDTSLLILIVISALSAFGALAFKKRGKI